MKRTSGMMWILSAGTLLFIIINSLQASAYTPPDVINVTMPGLIPEGIEWHPKKNLFLIGSITQGVVHTVDDSGNTQVFVQDPRLFGSVGLEIDMARNKLYIANFNFSGALLLGGQYTPGTVLSSLVVADATTGQVIYDVDLTSLNSNTNFQFANDLTFDPTNGNIYITDTFGGMIFEVNGQTHAARVYSNYPGWVASPQGLPPTINGIKYVNGYLLTCAGNTGEIFKVSLNQGNNNPPTVELVKGVNVESCDGMRVTARKNPMSIVISSAVKVTEVGSNDNWVSGFVMQSQDTIFKGVSTTALRPYQEQGGARKQLVYALNLNFAKPPTEPNEIERSITIDLPNEDHHCGCHDGGHHGKGKNGKSETVINFFFADMLNGMH